MKTARVGYMDVKVYDTRAEMGASAAKHVAAFIKAFAEIKPEVNVIFAAAPSQNELLEALVADKTIDWSRVNAFHMDEYIGLPSTAPQQFSKFLTDRLFGLLPFKSVHTLNGTNDPAAECERYAALLRQYPIDIVCLGIGENGHLAFNDPPVADFEDPALVKVVELEEVCRQQQVNDGCFKTLADVPKTALTLTVPTLLNVPVKVTIVPGSTKTEAVYRTLNWPVGTACPATALRLVPSTLYLDSASAARVL